MSSVNQTFFWAVSAKGLQHSLVYTPSVTAEPEEALTLVIRDCDGAEVNRAEIIFPSSKNCLFEMEPLFGLMKTETGIKHGLVTLESQSKGRTVSRYQSGQNATFVASDQLMTNIRQGLVPINNQGNRDTLLALTNCENSAVQIRAKFLFGKRSPEVNWELSPYSSRIIDIGSAFTAAIGDENVQALGRGYIRLSTSAIEGVLFHTVVYDQLDDGGETIQIF